MHCAKFEGRFGSHARYRCCEKILVKAYYLHANPSGYERRDESLHGTCARGSGVLSQTQRTGVPNYVEGKFATGTLSSGVKILVAELFSSPEEHSGRDGSRVECDHSPRLPRPFDGGRGPVTSRASARPPCSQADGAAAAISQLLAFMPWAEIYAGNKVRRLETHSEAAVKRSQWLPVSIPAPVVRAPVRLYRVPSCARAAAIQSALS